MSRTISCKFKHMLYYCWPNSKVYTRIEKKLSFGLTLTKFYNIIFLRHPCEKKPLLIGLFGGMGRGEGR